MLTSDVVIYRRCSKCPLFKFYLSPLFLSQEVVILLRGLFVYCFVRRRPVCAGCMRITAIMLPLCVVVVVIAMIKWVYISIVIVDRASRVLLHSPCDGV